MYTTASVILLRPVLLGSPQKLCVWHHEIRCWWDQSIPKPLSFDFEPKISTFSMPCNSLLPRTQQHVPNCEGTQSKCTWNLVLHICGMSRCESLEKIIIQVCRQINRVRARYSDSIAKSNGFFLEQSHPVNNFVV